MRIAIYVVPVALVIYALFDLFRSEPHERAGLRPALWALIIVLLPVVGPIAWIFVSTLRRAEARAPSGRPGDPRRTLRPTRRPGLTAPDDDPDFLRDLEEQWKREGGADPAPRDPDAPAS